MAIQVYNGFDLESLASRLMQDLSAEWRNPFDSPLVLFSDKKVEQWFQLYWLTCPQGGRTGRAVMNLRTVPLDRFLFSLLQDPSLPVGKQEQRLTSDQLRNMLLAKLASRTADGLLYYKTLGAAQVEAYLERADGKSLDIIHLYDFAEQLAKLFIDYEVTRPDDYDGQGRGLIEAWSRGDRFFDGSAVEDWQRRLYRDISLLLESSEPAYLTLPRLFFKNKQKNGGKPRFNYSGSGVYLLGFSGMGQIYRKILQDFGAEHNLFIYVQGSPLLEQAENLLAKKWGAFGKENVSWWASCCPSGCSPAEASPAADASSTLALLQQAVRQNKPLPAREEALKMDGSFSITPAASKIREVEHVHSQICALLKEGRADQRDILVLAPAMSQYRTALYEAFSQNDPDFPRLPFVIADAVPEESLVCLALNTLLSLLERAEISRPAFFALVRNPFVQKVRAIEPEYAESWSSWVSEMHVYRDAYADGKSSRQDWRTGARRMLLARLTDEKTSPADGGPAYFPYSDIESGDDGSLERFVDCIDALEAFVAFCREKDAFTPSDLQLFLAQLNGWLRYDKSDDSDFTTEQAVYRGIVKEIANQEQILKMGITQAVSKKALFLALSDAAKDAHESIGSLFTGGITFTSFRPNRILPAKYIFFMGLDSKSFPGTDSRNMLDLRATAEAWLCDDSIESKDTFAFLCQFMAAKEGLFLSYVDNDLQKDEEFYRSSVINDLLEATAWDEKTVDKNRLSIDEKRPWSQLYSARAFRNKKNYLQLGAAGQELEPGPEAMPAENLASPDTVALSQLKNYLEDPFQFRMNTLFGRSDDDSDEERLQFEPIETDSLTNAALIKKIVKLQLQGIPADKEEIERLFATGQLPEKVPFGDRALQELLDTGEKIIGRLSGKAGRGGKDYISGAELHIDEAINLALDEPKSWLLTGSANIWWQTGSDLYVLEVKKNDSVKPSAFLTDYLCALALVAGKAAGTRLCVHLLVCADKPVREKSFPLSQDQARGLLAKLYRSAFIEKYSTCLPVDALEEKAPANLREFAESLNGEFGGWSFFRHRRIVNPLTDIGFTEAGFAGEWTEAALRQRALCLFLESGEGQEVD